MFYFLKLTNRPIFKKKLSMNYFVSIKSEEASPGCTDIQAFYWASMWPESVWHEGLLHGVVFPSRLNTQA